ncbi:hypothetical protein ONZ43_g1772 [Nemania bipapillata]|uniref:Uncharacterized protein n=1 Tax=Nemania bipapillata TaxID=110536 RepID=A0ACC2J354_9PEZI|nr:hypothetical protein ONZ43_g1772 [Nemania bipapillata]
MIGFSASRRASVVTPSGAVVPGWYLCLPLVSIRLSLIFMLRSRAALYSTHLDISELMSSHMLKRNPGMPLSWYLVSELALVIANIIVIGFTSTYLEYRHSYPSRFNYAINVTPVLVFTWFFSITRLALFVMACIDMHRYLAAKKVERALQIASKLGDIEEGTGLSREDTTGAADGIVRLQELPMGPRSPQELESQFTTPELEGSSKQPVQQPPVIQEQKGNTSKCPGTLLKLHLCTPSTRDSPAVNEMPSTDT